MAKYKVKHTNIMHGNNLYKEGSIIELTKDEAARLSDFVDFIEETKSESANSTKAANTKTNKTSNKSKTTKTKTEEKSETVKDETKSETLTKTGEGTDGGDVNGK